MRVQIAVPDSIAQADIHASLDGLVTICNIVLLRVVRNRNREHAWEACANVAGGRNRGSSGFHLPLKLVSVKLVHHTTSAYGAVIEVEPGMFAPVFVGKGREV